MKVYVLSEFTHGYQYNLGVFDKPKTARQFIEGRYSIVSTKNEWKIDHHGGGYYVHGQKTFTVQEFTLKKDK